MDNLQAGTPMWWLDQGIKALQARAPQVARLQNYYDGSHPLAFASKKFADAFGGLFSQFADNWCELVVDAVEERLTVQGFRFGDGVDADTDAWHIWQRNGLDAESQICHTETLVCASAAAMVWAGADGLAEITIEHPEQMVVFCSSTNRRIRLAAVKRWADDDGYLRANVYLPDMLWKYQSREKTGTWTGGDPRWAEWTVGDETQHVPNPLGVVPVVPFANRSRLIRPPRSEIANVIPINDGINKLVADMLVASEYAAMPQRWVTGLDIEVDEETNQPIAPFKVELDKILQATDPATKFGQFSAADLGNYTAAIEMLVQHVASQTRTPPHYFYLSGQFPSGESIKSAETGLVSKAARKQLHFGESWEEVLRLAFAVEGRPQAMDVGAETIWRDPESRTESEHVDAVMKKMSLGVPQQMLWEELGYSPQQIERMRDMQRAQAMDQMLVGADAQMALLTGVLPPAPPAG